MSTSPFQRVIFVGMHNKPGMKPLDSRTKSGKLIDRIGDRLRYKGMEVLKTNLYDVDYYPVTHEEKQILAFNWIERVSLFKEDIIVLLGAEVHNNFPPLPVVKIKAAHPSSKRSHVEMDAYVIDVVGKIENHKTV